MIDADRDCDLVVAVGTGSINDMCRFFSFQMGVPYAIVATAAPMDGFASSGAALIINSMKTTIPGSDTAVYYRRYRYSLWSTCKNGICRTWRSAW